MGKTEAEIAKIRVQEQDRLEVAVATYIGNMFLQYQDRRIICAPYMFKYVLVVNSLNIFYIQSSYCLIYKIQVCSSMCWINAGTIGFVCTFGSTMHGFWSSTPQISHRAVIKNSSIFYNSKSRFACVLFHISILSTRVWIWLVEFIRAL